jgi:pyruvate dehydrogenase E1 component alpha subunit
LIECLTYRWLGHHEGDPGVAYRTKEEIAAWKERDPIKRLRGDEIAARPSSQAEFDRIDAEIRDVMEDAAQFALASPLESVETALKHVFHSPAD